MNAGANLPSSLSLRSNWPDACRFFSFLTFVIASFCLASWFFQAPHSNALSMKWIPVAPSTAICFWLLAVAQALQAGSNRAFFARHLPRVVGLFLLTVAGLRLLEWIVPISTPVDRWLFLSNPTQVGEMQVGIMAFPTALGFLFLGLGLLATPDFGKRAAMSVTVFSASGALGLGLAFLVGYIYGAPLMYGRSTIPMAFLTALCFVLSSLGLLSLVGSRLYSERGDFLRAIQALNAALGQRVVELEQIQADFASLAERNLDGLIVQDSAGQVIYCNDAARALLGPEFETGWLPRLAVPVFEHEVEGRVLEVRGEETTWRGSPGLLLCLRDVTARRAVQQSLESSREQLFLAQKMEAVGRLAGGIAHDFNNILTAVLGYCGLLEDEPDLSPQARESLSEVTRAAQRAADLTGQLLAYSKHASWSPQACDLNEIVRKASGLLERLLKNDVVLNFEFWPQAVWVLADPSRLEQVLMNLVVNARDASPAGARVGVRVFLDPDNPEGRTCCLSVSDQGGGVPEEDLLKIFDPFFTTKSPSGGTGLGLSICRSIADQCGAELSVENRPGQGAVFTLRLQPTSGIVEAETSKAPLDRGSQTILLVEDEDSIRRLLGSILKKHGYSVLEASGPHEAEEIALAHPEISLLLTDIAMPGGSGLDLARSLLGKRAGLKAILMSGYSPATQEPHENSLPYLQKPFTAPKLLEVVGQTLAFSTWQEVTPPG